MAEVPATEHAFLEEKPSGYCRGKRTVLIDFLASHHALEGRALDVGCSGGSLGAELLERGFSRVVGIEPMPEAAQQARTVLSDVVQGTLQDIDRSALGTFDLVVFADSLEHMLDPWTALSHARDLMNPQGALLLSVPNVSHWSVLWRALKLGRWDYKVEGLLDRTHLRFFTPGRTRLSCRSAVAGSGRSWLVSLRIRWYSRSM
jgi:2-polyprenyl-3-methyl-5-hydroxy-6-metoxy-1,4-benzoquinol methylase